ncbi:MAG: hypothetical protein AB7F25_07010 [Deferribacterales bacterium]
MAFPTIGKVDIEKMDAGEYIGNAYEIDSTATFEDGLKFGRVAKLDSGSLDNLDGSSTPVIAGIVLRTASNPIEDGYTYTTENTVQVDYLTKGRATVEVLSGETPAFGDAVRVVNAGGATDGQVAVTSAAGTISITGWRFIKSVKTGVAIVEVK